MMDLTVLLEYFSLLIVTACLVVGYIIKTSLDFVPNKYIPTILAVVGVLANCIYYGVSMETVVYGAVMGLASTGMHQAFTKAIGIDE